MAGMEAGLALLGCQHLGSHGGVGGGPCRQLPCTGTCQVPSKQVLEGLSETVHPLPESACWAWLSLARNRGITRQPKAQLSCNAGPGHERSRRRPAPAALLLLAPSRRQAYTLLSWLPHPWGPHDQGPNPQSLLRRVPPALLRSCRLSVPGRALC